MILQEDISLIFIISVCFLVGNNENFHCKHNIFWNGTNTAGKVTFFMGLGSLRKSKKQIHIITHPHLVNTTYRLHNINMNHLLFFFLFFFLAIQNESEVHASNLMLLRVLLAEMQNSRLFISLKILQQMSVLAGTLSVRD